MEEGAVGSMEGGEEGGTLQAEGGGRGGGGGGGRGVWLLLLEEGDLHVGAVVVVVVHCAVMVWLWWWVGQDVAGGVMKNIASSAVGWVGKRPEAKTGKRRPARDVASRR